MIQVVLRVTGNSSLNSVTRPCTHWMMFQDGSFKCSILKLKSIDNLRKNSLMMYIVKNQKRTTEFDSIQILTSNF